MSVAELPIQINREKVAEFCRVRGIRKLSVFGSVLHDDFDPLRSDVDVLVEFAPGVRPGLKFFGYGDELSEIIGQKVDFNTPEWLSKYFRDQVLREGCPFMSEHDPGVTLRQIAEYARHARELCAGKSLPELKAD